VSTSRIDIDLTAIGHNVQVLRRVLSGDAAGPVPVARDLAPPDRTRTQRLPGICAVLKQDAYGLGAVRVARRLAACGVEMIAVYSLEEARALAEATIVTPILVLMPVRSMDRGDPVYRHAVAGKLHLTVHDPDQLAAISEVCGKLGAAMPLHVQVDTGLARGGSLPDIAAQMVESIARNPRLRLGGLMTHFASPASDVEFTREQARVFREWVERVKPVIAGTVNQRVDGSLGIAIHAANSCAMFRSSKYHGNLVRAGQSLYGFALEGANERDASEFAAAASQLRPAVRWTSSIVQVKDIPTGHPVGYGSTWRAARPTKIALVPVGYADGYPRILGNIASVGVTGRMWERTGATLPPGAEFDPGAHSGTAQTRFMPVIGRVSMDQITVDVTDVPDSFRRVGCEIELIGSDRSAPNFLARIAEGAQTIVHEQLCRIGSRVERVYRMPAADMSPQIHVMPDKSMGGSVTGSGGMSPAVACDYRVDQV